MILSFLGNKLGSFRWRQIMQPLRMNRSHLRNKCFFLSFVLGLKNFQIVLLFCIMGNQSVVCYSLQIAFLLLFGMHVKWVRPVWGHPWGPRSETRPHPRPKATSPWSFFSFFFCERDACWALRQTTHPNRKWRKGRLESIFVKNYTMWCTFIFIFIFNVKPYI